MLRANKIDVGEAVIECFVDGAGPTVVMFPSGAIDARYFDDFVRRLVAAGFCTVAVNPRGIGESSGPLEGLTLHALAADVARVIEVVDGGPVHLLGHGFGNRVVRCLAADRPDLIRSLILLGGTGLAEPDAAVMNALRSWFSHDATPAQTLDAMTLEVADPASAEGLLRQITRYPVAGMAHVVADRATPVEDWQANPIDAPVLVVSGVEDRIASPAHAEALRTQLGDHVRCVEIPRAAHVVFLEQPEATADAVIAFLRA